MEHFFGKFLSLKVAGLIFLMIIEVGQAVAQCDCDHTVPASVRHFYGDAEGVLPGDVICVEGGNRGKLRLHNIEGTEAEPVIIKNCGGQVVIIESGTGTANIPLCLNGNKHFRLTGTGDPAYKYGFKIGGEAHASVEAQGRATNFEMDHIEVVSSGFAGFMLKTDPDSEERNVRPEDPDAVGGGFTMYDVSVHDCYIHDMLPDGEGIYMGNSFWSSGKRKNGDPDDRQYPHSIYGAKIYNNLIERTGREAIQAGAVVEGLEIYNNRIYDYGYKNPNGAQNNGIQIGEGSSGKIYNNFIKNGPDGGTRAIYLLGLGDNYVYNNVVIGPRNVAMNANLRPSPLPDDPGNQDVLGGAYFINNTIIDTKGSTAFSTYLNTAPDNVLYNNLVVTLNDDWDGIIDGDWTKSNNQRYVTVEEAGVTDLYGDYRLVSGSSAIDAGMDASTYGISVDHLGAFRPENGVFDVGAHEYNGEISANTSPLLAAIGDQVVDEDSTIDVNISASDGDGDNLTLSAANLPSFASLTDNGDGTGVLSISPLQGNAGTYSEVGITVNDGNGGQDSETFTITVTGLTEPEPEPDPDPLPGGDGTPVYRINAGGYAEADSVMDWSVDKQTDPSPYFDSNSVNYTTGSSTWSGTNNTHAPDNIYGPYRYDNNASWGERQHWSFPVANGDYTVRLYFKSIATTAGTNVFGVAIESNSVLSNYDVFAAAGGSNIPVEETFAVTVSDGNLDIDFPIVTGKSFIHGIEILTSASANNPPVLVAIPDQSVEEDSTLNINVSASDQDNDPVVLSVSNLPSCASFTDNGDGTGLLAVVPQQGDTGEYPGVEVIANDGKGGVIAEAFTITVVDVRVNVSPVINPIGNQSVEEGATLSVNVSASDEDGDAITLNTSNLPSFASFIDSGDGTGIITISPLQGDAGTYPGIEIIASDEKEGQDSETFAITVYDNTSSDCNCNHTVSTDSSKFNGNYHNVLPGDVICMNGDYGRLRFESIVGTEANPVVIQNCGGVATVYSTTSYGWKFVESKNFILSGAGTSDPYGIKVTSESGFYLTMEHFTTDFEIFRVEVAGIEPNGVGPLDGFAGIGIKTSPYQNCELFEDPTRQAWIMRNIYVHDNYIHDTGGEGIYMGHGFYSGRIEANCPNITYSHSIKTVRVYNNRIENVGFDGIQIKNADEDVKVYNNYIANVGMRGEGAHDEGLFIGDGCVGDVFDNIIINVPGWGFDFRGLGNLNFYNNLIANTGREGFYLNGNEGNLSESNSYIRVVNNTLVKTGRKGVRLMNYSGIDETVLVNNIIAGVDPGYSVIEGSWTLQSNNLENRNVSEIGFIGYQESSGSDFLSNDYRLMQNSIAVDFGMDVSTFDVAGLGLDLDGNSRPHNSKYDIGAYEYKGEIPANTGPLLVTIGDQVVDEDSTLNVNISASDTDGNNLTLSATNLPSFASLTDNGDGTGILAISPLQGNAGTYSEVGITVNDGNGGQDSETFTITVTGLTEPEPDPEPLPAGDGSPVYRINAGGYAEADSVMDWAVDKQTEPSPYFDANSVNYTTGSSTWSGTNNTHAPDNIFGPYRYDNNASWGERQHWSFPVANGDYTVRLYFKSIATTAGTNVFGVAIEGNSVLSNYDVFATAGGSNIPVEETFTVTVSDGNLDIDLPIVTGKSFIHGIEILTSANNPPALVAIPDQSVDEDTTLNINVSASDQDNDPVVLSTSNLPSFASFTDNGDGTGLLTVAPQQGDTGEYPGVEVIASDGKGGVVAETFTITVTDVNVSPEISPIGNQSVEEGTTLSVNVLASDEDGDAVTLSTSNLPAFASFTDNGDGTGIITISPLQGDAGNFEGIEVVAEDGRGGFTAEAFSVTVNSVNAEAGAVIYRINAGGYMEPDAVMDWAVDKQTDPSPYFDSNCVNYTTGSSTWSGTNNTSAPDNIFGPYRYDNGASFGDRQRWDFPVSNGDYEVHLYFKAIGTSAGSNVFDVAVEGNVVLDEYDIYATAGGSGIPVEEVFIVTVNDGNLDIDFPSITTGRSIINGIEIVSSGSSSSRVNNEANDSFKRQNSVSKVYPNPVEDHLNIDLMGWNADSAVELYLLDNSGKQLTSRQVQRLEGSKIIEMDVSGLQLTPGIYYLKIQSKEYQEVRKILKQ